MAPVPDNKSDSNSESPADVAAGWIWVIMLSLGAIMLIIVICSFLNLNGVFNIVSCWIKNAYTQAKAALSTTRLKAKSLFNSMKLKNARTQGYDPHSTSNIRLQHMVPLPKPTDATNATTTSTPDPSYTQ